MALELVSLKVAINKASKELDQIKAKTKKGFGQIDFARYENDSVGFAYDVLGIKFLSDDQIKVMRSVEQNRVTNVKAAHAVGKTFLAAILVLWWVFCVKGKVITTAPSFDQVKYVLWKDIHKLYDPIAHKLGGRCLEVELQLSATAYGKGISSKDYDPNSFQGYHDGRIMVIQDEACGIKPAIDDGAVSCTAGENNRLLRLGNPVEGGNPFEKHCQEDSISIPAHSHPNVKDLYYLDDEGTPRIKPEYIGKIFDDDGNVKPESEWGESVPKSVIDGAISVYWIENIRKTKGESSAFWQGRVMAEFPTDNSASLIPRSWFRMARQRYDENPKYWDDLVALERFTYGLDVGDGDDKNALGAWQGRVLRLATQENTKGDMQDVDRAAQLALRHMQVNQGHAVVDRIGVGAGAPKIIMDGIADEKLEYCSVEGVAFGGKSPDPDYRHYKDYYYLAHLREGFRTGYIAIAPLGEFEDELMEQLAGIHYEETNNKTIVESKDKTKARLNGSPDLGDGVMMAASKAFALPVKQTQMEWSPVGRNRIKSRIADY